MIAEATSQNRGPGFDLSAGIHRRQVWRPAGLRGVESILSGIASRNKPFDDHRARLTAWYEQFVQRSQPFIGWQPLTKAESEADDTQSSFGSTQSAGADLAKRVADDLQRAASLTRPVSVAQDQPSAAPSAPIFWQQQRPQEPSLLRRSISGPIHTAAKIDCLQVTAAGDLSSPHEPQGINCSAHGAVARQEDRRATPPCRLTPPNSGDPLRRTPALNRTLERIVARCSAATR